MEGDVALPQTFGVGVDGIFTAQPQNIGQIFFGKAKMDGQILPFYGKRHESVGAQADFAELFRKAKITVLHPFYFFSGFFRKKREDMFKRRIFFLHGRLR